ncbi:DDB1- and CUL4-associated factor 6-like isoform X2 [Lycorma delicatula]|uniref:DDB1- and CUL4-associated factor 6-like isoform X2 n=1 Tax=Lycorma delicatula TaxID=130591 RepID=UPI003F5128D7
MKTKKPNSIFRNIYEQPYHEANRIKLYNSAKGSLDLVQRLGLLRKLPIHNGCVNCICWSDNGDLLLSGSDDQHLVVSHAYTYKMLTDYKTSHRANIFSAKFLPCSGDKNIISCSGDGIILFTDLVRPSDTHNCQFNCHTGTTYEVATIPGDPHTFLSCGEDYTVRCFDLRIKESCNKSDCQEDVLISCQRAVTALTINNMVPHQLAIGCSDSTVRLFDRRMLGTKSSGFSHRSGIRPVLALVAPGLEGKSYRITSLAFSPEGEDILVSYSSEHLYLFSTIHQNHSQLLKQDNCGGDDNDNGDNCVDMDDVKVPVVSLPPIRRLRLRGDWSDTGPDARPEREPGRSGDVAQARPTLHATLMQRMTDVLSRMLNDPATRAALSHGGEDEPFNENENEHDHDHEDNMSSSERIGQEQQDNENNIEHVHLPEPEHDQEQEQFVDLDEVDNNSAPNQQLQVNLLSVDIVTQSVVDGNIEPQSTANSSDTDQPNCTVAAITAPHHSPVSDAEGSEGSAIDPIWCSADPESEQNVPVAATSTTSGEVVSLPSFESTYSSYSLVKSPAVSQQAQTLTGIHTTSSAISSSSSTEGCDDLTQLQSLSSNITSSISSSSNSSTASDQSLRSLTDQLSNMRHGFIEKHGTEPMVNLHYSDKGSTASRITMSVGDELNREQVDNHRIPTITTIPSTVTTDTATVDSTGTCLDAVTDVGVTDDNVDVGVDNVTGICGPSCSNIFSSSSHQLDTPTVVEPMSEEDESILNSDDETDIAVTSPPLKRMAQDPLSRQIDSAPERESRISSSSPSSSAQYEHYDRVKLRQVPIKQKYTGHRNARTMIKEATFWGNDYILSGSDCGHVFIWDRYTARLVMLLEADHHVVNCIQPHPQLPLLATSGIDYDVKLWAPIHEEPVFDTEMADELMKRNEVMLEETKDTITVPASFMIRMLACLNQIRRRRSRTRPGSRVGPGGEGTSNGSD